MIFRKTKAGVVICPFFVWTSEDIIHNENDMSLSFCTHPKNPDDYEGNCQEKLCPLLTRTVNDADLCGRLAKGDPDSI